MEKRGLNIYFIHSDNYDFNQLLYLPCLRSPLLSNHTLIFPESEANKEVYYRDIMDRADVYVVELTNPDNELNIQLKYALMSNKPILALAQKDVGYDQKFQKMLKNVIGYSTEQDVRNYVETFVNTYKDLIFNGKVDPTIVLGLIQ